MTIKNYSKQCLMISAGIMVLALLLSLFGKIGRASCRERV